MDEHGSVDQVEIQLGHLCNNRCVFCASGLITSLALVGQEDSSKALAHLEDARRRGARKVTFLGGEPTLQRDFPALLQRARELGYQEIVVFTNGVRVQQREYFEALVAGGPLTFRISIQGGDQPTHDRVVGREGAFQRILDGMELMRAQRQNITVNACLNVLSYASVRGYASLARTYGVTQVHLDQVSPHEIGNRPPGYLGTILVRYSEQAPHLADMLARFERELGADYDVNLGNLPFCVLPDWAHRIHHAGQATLVIQANLDGPYHEGHDKYERKTAGREKTPDCARCAFDPVCTGVFDAYLERFGAAELQPIPRERLLAQRNAPELYTLIERDALARLVDRRQVGAFSFERAEIGPRDPEARFSYTHPVLGGVELGLRHPRARGTALSVGARHAVHLVRGSPSEAVLELVRAVLVVLGEEPHELSLAVAARRHRWGYDARATLSRMVERLLASGEASGARWARDGESVSVGLREADGSELRVVLGTGSSLDGPPVRALFPKLAPSEAQPVQRAMHRVKLALRA